VIMIEYGFMIKFTMRLINSVVITPYKKFTLTYLIQSMKILWPLFKKLLKNGHLESTLSVYVLQNQEFQKNSNIYLKGWRQKELTF